MTELNFGRILVTKEDIISMYSKDKVNHQRNALKYYEALEIRKKLGYGSLRISQMINMPLGAVHYWFLGNEPKSVKGINELKSMGLLPFKISSNKSFEHFVRTFGLRFSDGCVYHQKRNNSYTGYLCFGKKEDAQSYIQDSLNVWGIRMKHHYSSKAYYVYLPASMVRLMIFLGSPVGSKTKQHFIVPNWIFSLPNKLKAAFLDGVFTGDASVPKLKKSGKSCESLRLSMNSEKSVVQNFSSGFMFDLWELLEEIGIHASKPKIHFNQPRISKNNVTTYPVDIRIITEKRNMINFLGEIPYTYCTKGNKRVNEILAVLKND